MHSFSPSAPLSDSTSSNVSHWPPRSTPSVTNRGTGVLLRLWGFERLAEALHQQTGRCSKRSGNVPGTPRTPRTPVDARRGLQMLDTPVPLVRQVF